MKFAIIADIHANLEAFQAVLKDAEENNCTHHAFLGDFVGYCADPKACIDIIRSLGAPCVIGNFDLWCATDLPLDGFNSNSAKSIAWTRKQLTQDDQLWLQGLPYIRQVEDFTIVHGSLNEPQRWGYVFDRFAATASLELQRTDVCFFGHTHVPLAFVRDSTVRGGTYTKFRIEKGSKYFVNPGAVGQPRDNCPKAAYVIYDKDESTIELRRLEYDIATTQRKIREAGLGSGE
jgi:predicted phosphodiesterase